MKRNIKNILSIWKSRWTKFRKQAGATYDPNTKRITGAVYGTLTYFHEEGHKRQDESGRLGTAFMWQRWIMYIIVAQILWELDLGILVYIMLIPEIYLEADAWVYAFKKRYKRKRFI